MSSLAREIVVDYDLPSGCFDRLVLVCETILFKQRKIFTNATVCTDLIPNEFYRIYVETKRSGWETIASDSIEIHLFLPKKIDQQTRKSSQGVFFFSSIRMSSIISQEEFPSNRSLLLV